MLCFSVKNLSHPSWIAFVNAPPVRKKNFALNAGEKMNLNAHSTLTKNFPNVITFFQQFRWDRLKKGKMKYSKRANFYS